MFAQNILLKLPKTRIDFLLHLEEDIMPSYRNYEFKPEDTSRNPDCEYMRILRMLDELEKRALVAKDRPLEIHLWNLSYGLEEYFMEQYHLYQNEQNGLPRLMGLAYSNKDFEEVYQQEGSEYTAEFADHDTRYSHHKKHGKTHHSSIHQRRADRVANAKSRHSMQAVVCMEMEMN